MRILVAVASIQTGALKAEVGEGFRAYSNCVRCSRLKTKGYPCSKGCKWLKAERLIKPAPTVKRQVVSDCYTQGG